MAKPPTTIGSLQSPTRKELLLYTYEQLDMVSKTALISKARDLEGALKEIATVASQDLCGKFRAHAEKAAVIQWMLEAQVLVLSHVEKQERFTVFDFGFPSSAHEEQLVYTGNLPSIKGKCEKKAPSSPEQRATMHDIPARRW